MVNSEEDTFGSIAVPWLLILFETRLKINSSSLQSAAFYSYSITYLLHLYPVFAQRAQGGLVGDLPCFYCHKSWMVGWAEKKKRRTHRWSTFWNGDLNCLKSVWLPCLKARIELTLSYIYLLKLDLLGFKMQLLFFLILFFYYSYSPLSVLSVFPELMPVF